jgi:haloalkane dehalogenase
MAPYIEHRIPRGEWTLYAREYTGEDPAFVLMHGFPDNLLIYDALASALAAAGRRAIAFDFLGYGASDKPVSHEYTSEGLEADLEAVVLGLRLPPVVLVAHDASGPTTLNWALGHQQHIAGVGLLNTYYEPTASLRFPELISLFADPDYADLCAAIGAEPGQLNWLFGFQGKRFYRDAPAEVRDRAQIILPIVQRQFAGTRPGSSSN